MTPKLYSLVGRRYNQNKKTLWLMVVLSLLAILTTTFAYSKLNIVIPYQIPFGISAMFLLLAWGILLSIYWYAPDGKISPEKIEAYSGIKKSFSQFISWYVSIFLTIWFLLVISLLPWLLWKQIANG